MVVAPLSSAGMLAPFYKLEHTMHMQTQQTDSNSRHRCCHTNIRLGDHLSTLANCELQGHSNPSQFDKQRLRIQLASKPCWILMDKHCCSCHH
jgi:hypothetical protein